MKKVIILLIAVVLVGVTTVFADEILTAAGIRYKNRTVESSLNELYIKANAKNIESARICKLIDETYGSFGSIGSKYECEVAPNVKYNFYLLELDSNNNTIDLIMDRNIDNTMMTWPEAMKYFKTGAGSNIGWSNVLNINLPSAQAIANVVTNSSFDITNGSLVRLCFEENSNSIYCTNNTNNYFWLWDYIRDCESWGCEHSLDSNNAYGYWTSSIVPNSNYSWIVYRYGQLSYDVISSYGAYGIRPVITVLTTNLYSE